LDTIKASAISGHQIDASIGWTVDTRAPEDPSTLKLSVCWDSLDISRRGGQESTVYLWSRDRSGHQGVACDHRSTLDTQALKKTVRSALDNPLSVERPEEKKPQELSLSRHIYRSA